MVTAVKLWPFFCYYGGKWRAAHAYPEPAHSSIVEPFAGAAGYSTRYADRDVLLIDKDQAVVNVWRFLIEATAADVLRLPLLEMDQSLDDFAQLSDGERDLIGFWLNKGTARPCRRPSAWMRSGIRPRSYWGEEVRARIARQVEHVSHWRVMCGDYRHAPAQEATWFVDPPYQVRGSHYRHSVVDYEVLGAWCRGLRGQVIVCEQSGADWLPFEPFRRVKTNGSKRGRGYSAEVVWFG